MGRVSVSSLITWPTKLKFCRMILDTTAQSRSVPDFAIFCQGALWGRAFWNLQFPSGASALPTQPNLYPSKSTPLPPPSSGWIWTGNLNIHNDFRPIGAFPYSRSKLDFSISLKGVGARLLHCTRLTCARLHNIIFLHFPFCDPRMMSKSKNAIRIV